MNPVAKVLLIALRLAIGWHFLFEGLEKVHSVYLGPTETSKPWTGEGFYREANGPLGPFLRSQIGDLDNQMLAYLTLEPTATAEGAGKTLPYQRMPAALGREWDDYVARVAAHYKLTEQQRDLVAKKVQQAKEAYVMWLTTGTKEVIKSFPKGDVEVNQTTQQRIDDYRSKVKEIRETLEQKLPAFGKDVEKTRLRTLKTDAAKMRASLKADVDKATADMRKGVEDVLRENLGDAAVTAAGPVPEPAANATLKRMDWMTRWMLVIVGSLLLIGLFTRPAALIAAGFLLMVYLSSPPLPWLPSPPQVEGHYLFVNKNLIEMLALLLIAATPSGRWFGVDALMGWVCAAYCRTKVEAKEPVAV